VGKRAKQAEAAVEAAEIGFDIDEAKLPEEIEAAALASGKYPYDKKLKRKKYEKQLLELQIELAKLQAHLKTSGERIVVVFEGRDSAGKGGCIQRFTQHLNPRYARIVALTKPTEAERGQWYFQRYVAQMPARGEMALFDRSWYNRAGVERVMGFCSEDEAARFLREAPEFEQMLVRDGIRLFKIFLDIGREMQLKRFHSRRHDPLKRWKLSDIDLAAIPKFDDYSRAQAEMFRYTHTPTTPWVVVRANDQRRARLETMRYVLAGLNYTDKDEAVIGEIDKAIVGSGPEFFDVD
jgi:polyphosphate kinase